jgi:hypothetical protein
MSLVLIFLWNTITIAYSLCIVQNFSVHIMFPYLTEKWFQDTNYKLNAIILR